MRRRRLRVIYTPCPMWECPICGQRWHCGDERNAFAHESRKTCE